MTSHAYFNLSGSRSGCGALNRELTLFADAFTPVTPGLWSGVGKTAYQNGLPQKPR